MTDNELSLVIAEFLEPKPEDSIAGRFSNPKFWHWVISFTAIDETDGVQRLEPRDMVQDPAMRDLLLEKLLEADFHFTYWPRPGNGVVAHFANSSGFFFKLEAEFERIPAEAFAKSKGLM